MLIFYQIITYFYYFILLLSFGLRMTFSRFKCFISYTFFFVPPSDDKYKQFQNLIVLIFCCFSIFFKVKSSQYVLNSYSLVLKFLDLKACVRYFHQIFMIALQKLWKMLFISSKKLFSFSRYSNFCISVFSSFFTCRPLLWRMIEDKS